MPAQRIKLGDESSEAIQLQINRIRAKITEQNELLNECRKAIIEAQLTLVSANVGYPNKLK